MKTTKAQRNVDICSMSHNKLSMRCLRVQVLQLETIFAVWVIVAASL